ncbi:hypothetical protein JCM14076_06520 [Methylosoma difficile]
MADLTLKHPIEIGKITVSKLSFRDYTTAEDYLAFDVHGGVAQNIVLIASVSNTDETIIKRLRGVDYRAATKIVDALLAADNEEDQEKK